MQLWVRYKLGGKVFNKKVFVASANLDLGAGQMPDHGGNNDENKNKPSINCF